MSQLAEGASANAVKGFHDILYETLEAIKNLGIKIDYWDPLLLQILIKKLDRHTHTLYEESLSNPRELPKISEFLKFLHLRFQTLEATGYSHRPVAKGLTISTVKPKGTACIACKTGLHQLFACDEFRKLSPSDRLKLAQSKSLCVNCLKPGHKANACSRGSCLKCNKKHNTLLHLEQTVKATINTASVEEKGSEPVLGSLQIRPSGLGSRDTEPVSTSLVASHLPRPQGLVLLATARIKLTAQNGQTLECRALLDSGSQVSLVTERLVKRLGINAIPSSLKVEGLGNGKRLCDKRIVVTLQSLVSNFASPLEAYVMPNIVSIQPPSRVDISRLEIPDNIKLADPNFFMPQKIDVLLGAECYYQFLSNGKIRLCDELPPLQNSVLGWLVAGRIRNTHYSQVSCGILTEEADTDHLIEQFWRLEEVDESQRGLTNDEQLCEELFITNLLRDNTGRFVVKLPFKEDPRVLGDSKHLATNRFLSLENRLSRTPDVKLQYQQFMKEYEELGHMSEIKAENIPNSHYFIPHHCVLKPESSTTKLRVVFDASAKTTNGASLNELMHVGPPTQSELFSILLRFRLPRFVFTTDIEKMYRQVMVHPSDQMYQLIVWRNQAHLPLKYYKLNTITYGTRSAPYLATRCLQQLAIQAKCSHPFGAKALQHEFYVDDGLTGADDLNEAIKMQAQLISLLKSAGFKLRKWSANNPKLLQNIPVEDQEVSVDLVKDHVIKTLGLIWWPRTDAFGYKVILPTNSRATKRTVVSDLARIFDPLGLISPLITPGKIFIQDLWKLHLSWDEELPAEAKAFWATYRQGLEAIDDIKYPRHMFQQEKTLSVQIHTFCDASEKAYGAAVYIRAILKSGTVLVRLLCAKSRVAPVKQQTIPRLELCAALLAAQLTDRTKRDIHYETTSTYYWSDSRCVLSWIHSQPPDRFVANRVAKIWEMSAPNQWRHVGTKENPADILSRGCSPEKLTSTHLWFRGPMFLHGAESLWPSAFVHKQLSVPIKLEELNLRNPIVNLVTGFSKVIYDINHCNSFKKLQHVLGYVLRFMSHTKNKCQKRPKYVALTPMELDTATKVICRAMQATEFGDEVKHIKRRIPLSKSSCLSSLNPFLDDDGIMRVGGRLVAADLSTDTKHQIIIPYNDPLSKLLMTMLHEQHLHCGPQALLAVTRQRFWPLKGKIMARSIVQHCVRCTRSKPQMLSQMMGPLPRHRVEPARPFINAGVDYAGPVWIHFKSRGKKPQKAYIAVFCCFSTKAVHLELVSDLTTDAFIGAFKRFTSRRGHCRHLYCDNATNFVGAKRELQELSSSIFSSKAQEKIVSVCSDKGIHFHFIPPRAPHFGGLWEAAVKSAKHLLVRSVATASLTYEELETVIVEIEAILNSRPITPMSSDPDDIDCLTPGHFLIGEPLTAQIDTTASPSNIKLLARWKLVSHLKHEFWKRWCREYLNELQQRSKWTRPHPNVPEGTLVIIKEDNLPVRNWPLGRVTQTFMGSDGHVRVVEVKTAKGTLKRAIHRLAPLLPDDAADSAMEDIMTTRKKQIAPSEEVTQIPTKRQRILPGVNLLSIIAIMLCLPLVFGSPIEVTNFKQKPGIHFEGIGKNRIITTHWNLLVYYNTSMLNEEIRALSNGTRMLQRLCTKCQQGNLCNEIVGQFLHAADEFEVDNKLFNSRRVRRGAVNMIGNIANAMFGVLDSNYAEEMSGTIQNLHENEHQMRQLLQNQTSVIDSTINIIKRNHESTKEKLQSFEKILIEMSNHVRKTEQEFNDQGSFQLLTLLVVQLMTITSELRRKHTTIINVLTDVHHGHINPLLLSPHQLQEEILKIKAHLPPTLQLPISQNDILGIYKFMTVEMGITEEHILFKLSLPLINDLEFNLYQVIPVAVKINGSLIAIKPSTTIIAINDHGDTYFPMTIEQYDHCTLMKEQTYLCPYTQSIFHKGSRICECEVKLYNNETNAACELVKLQNDQWVQLNNKNRWIFAVQNPIKLTAACGTEKSQRVIDGSGYLQLQPTCVLKQSSFTIFGHSSLQSSVNASFMSHSSLPELASPKQLELLLLQNTTKPWTDELKELQTLQNLIKNQQILELPKQMKSRDYHQFGIGYSALMLVVIVIVVKCARQIIKHRDSRTPTPAPRLQREEAFTVHI